MMRAWVLCAVLWVSVGAGAFAGDWVEIAGRTYTFDEVAPPRSESANMPEVRYGPVSLREARREGAIRKTRALLVEQLPGVLGTTCDASVHAEEIASYARWWDGQAARFLRGVVPDDIDVWEGGDNSVWGDVRVIRHHDPGDADVVATATADIARLKRLGCVAAMFPEAPFGNSPNFGTRRGVAPIAMDTNGPPADLCMVMEPLGAIWDLIRLAEQRGLVVFHDRYVRRQLSASAQPRPSSTDYPGWPCFEMPPWERATTAAGAAQR
jgi:hypothetical protein